MLVKAPAPAAGSPGPPRSVKCPARRSMFACLHQEPPRAGHLTEPQPERIMSIQITWIRAPVRRGGANIQQMNCDNPSYRKADRDQRRVARAFIA